MTDFPAPFDFWCLQCRTHFNKGFRLNVKKQYEGVAEVGGFSFSYTFKCFNCKSLLTIGSDPETNELYPKVGLEKKDFTPAKKLQSEDPITEHIVDNAKLRRKENDPIYVLQNKEEDRKKALLAATEIKRLHNSQKHKEQDFDANSSLRRMMRGKRREVAARKKLAKKRGLGIEILPHSSADAFTSARQKFRKRNAQKKQDQQRKIIRTGSIFSNTSHATTRVRRHVGKKSKRKHI